MSFKKYGPSIAKAVLDHFVSNAWIYIQLIGALSQKDYPTVLIWLKALCFRVASKLLSNLMKSKKRDVNDRNPD